MKSSRSTMSSKRKLTPLSPLKTFKKQNLPTSVPFDLPRSITVAKNGEKIEIDCQSLEVEHEVRRGAFGFVEVMRHVGSDLRFAVKTIHVTDDEKKKKYLSIEIETMKQANSPFMVFCYGVMFWDCHVWICMEIMDLALDHFYGQCFDHEINIPENVLSYVAYCIISGLQYMKTELNMMHRDVKPTNILLNHSGEVKLCDFGISATLRNSVKKTIQAGCKLYMAPEKIQGSKKDKYDCKSDVWSLGITMIETATGRYPYGEWSTDFDMLRQVVNEPSPTLPEDGGFSKNFHTFINPCLLKDKECNLRPTYEELLEHDWIKCQDGKNVKRFIEDIVDAQKKAKAELPPYNEFECMTVADLK